MDSDFIVVSSKKHKIHHKTIEQTNELQEEIHKETKISQKYFLYDLYLKTLQLFTKKIIDTNLLKNKLSEVTVPLLYEINLIKDIKNRDILIIIDDLNMFNLKYSFADWSGISINKIKKIINERKFYIKKMKQKLIVVIKK